LKALKNNHEYIDNGLDFLIKNTLSNIHSRRVLNTTFEKPQTRMSQTPNIFDDQDTSIDQKHALGQSSGYASQLRHKNLLNNNILTHNENKKIRAQNIRAHSMNLERLKVKLLFSFLNVHVKS
jgi:hypothetical protein